MGSVECVCVWARWWWLKDGGERWPLSPCIPLRLDGLQMDAEKVLLWRSWEASGTEHYGFWSSRTSQRGCLKWADQSWRCIVFSVEGVDWEKTHRVPVPWVGFLSDWGFHCSGCWTGTHAWFGATVHYFVSLLLLKSIFWKNLWSVWGWRNMLITFTEVCFWLIILLTILVLYIEYNLNHVTTNSIKSRMNAFTINRFKQAKLAMLNVEPADTQHQMSWIICKLL